MVFGYGYNNKIAGSFCLWLLALPVLLASFHGAAQSDPANLSTPSGGWVSLGMRSTLSLFDHDGAGLGTGGQFRIHLSDRVATDWFADYITIHGDLGLRSTYYHIGWSVLFYPLANRSYPRLFQPYILAGHCFDFNEKSLIANPEVSGSRWGSAVQAGLGSHIHLTERFDLSITSQYMIHLTEGLEVERNFNGETHIHRHAHSALEGHLLTTMSFSYKLFRLWGK